jgi:hypothetical protein|tara:strand:+ start:188 stop:532 length:345 start_codon:yes stop_codon:yes gene_type:complete
MVEVKFVVEYEKKLSTATCPSKSNAVLTVSPAAGGFIFYQIKSDVGSVAEELSGMFTGVDKANAAIQTYYNNSRQTNASGEAEVMERIAKRKAKNNATTTKSKASDDVHQGASN